MTCLLILLCILVYIEICNACSIVTVRVILSENVAHEFFADLFVIIFVTKIFLIIIFHLLIFNSLNASLLFKLHIL